MYDDIEVEVMKDEKIRLSFFIVLKDIEIHLKGYRN